MDVDEILSIPDYEDDFSGSEPDYDDYENFPQQSLTNITNNFQISLTGTQTSCLPNQAASLAPHPLSSPTQSHLEVLKSKFHHDEFKDKQWEVISVILDFLNSSREPSKIVDQFIIASSGFGKSICYQFVPVYTNSLALVISPLISLMQDQVRLMTELGISAVYLSPSVKSDETIARLFNREFNIAYITPELCINRGKEFILNLHSKVPICLVAIDEAHCVSSWGHDFRPKYGRLSLLREWLRDVPFLALTATASKVVTNDIIHSLSLKNTVIHRTKLNRPNLYFEVYNAREFVIDMKMLLNKTNPLSLPEKYSFQGPCILYCLTRHLTDTCCKLLKKLGVKCDSYHAGMKDKDRKETYKKFIRDEIECIVATVAFGMGIDKPNIRLIIHYGAPKDLESYMQEAGRAGRDGLLSRCVIYYNGSDFSLIDNILSYKSRNQSQVYIKHCSNLVKKVEKFLTSNECRRKQLLANLDEELPVGCDPCIRCCDVCTRNNQSLISSPSSSSSSSSELFRKLLTIREWLATKFCCEANMICSTGIINRLATLKPFHMEHLRCIDCVSNHFCEKYGRYFLKGIRNFTNTDSIISTPEETFPYIPIPCPSSASSYCRSNLKRQQSGNAMDILPTNQVTDDTESSSSSKRKRV